MSINLREYLAASERRYSYRIKTVVPMDDEIVDRIERYLAKYLPVSIGKVVKTMFQRNPLDFPGIDHAEVFYLDITTALPASSYVLQQDIRLALGIPEKYIIVRAENEPTEIETQRINAITDIDQEATEKGLEPSALLNNPDYPEAEDVDSNQLYGDKYNAGLRDYLAKIAAEREAIVIKTKNAPFAWLEIPENELSPVQDKTNFNSDVKPSVEPVTVKKPDPRSKGGNGEMDNNTTSYKKIFQTKDGKPTVIAKTASVVSKKD